MSNRPVVPDILMSVINIIHAVPRMDTDDNWILNPDKIWSLRFKARLSVPESLFMPRESAWHLLIWSKGFDQIVRIYPDKEHGIDATFQHQDFNQQASSLPWRTGKPCLEQSLSIFGRRSWSDEPAELLQRIAWMLQRLMLWIDSAACSSLVMKGEPLELPVLPGAIHHPLVGFSETREDFSKAIQSPGQWGTASVPPLTGAHHTHYIARFHDQKDRIIRTPEWSAMMHNRKQTSNALWLMLEHLPVLAPWQAPTRWYQLNSLLSDQGISLEKIFTEAGIFIRRNRFKLTPSFLLLGFPLAEKIGSAPFRLHWLALKCPYLSHKSYRRDGFRVSERNHRRWDAEAAVSTQNLYWLQSSNWAPDQVRTRGGAEDEMKQKQVLIIGAGALGSAISDNLLRMGICRMGIMDHDTVAMGNLSRHVLDMSSVGRSKASALAEHLNRTMPDARVRAFNSAFPPENLQTSQAIKNYDVIIDCTADDDVLRALSLFEWPEEKLFISLSISWQAEGLFAFAASEARFPVVDALAHFDKSPAPPIAELDRHTEGMGCWHAVFPATAADIQLWASVSTRFILSAMKATGRQYAYYRQTPEGTVEKVNVE